MGNPKWTADQQQVIDLRGKNILVSAAAGSGKTAVLVERIISQVTEGDSPKDIDRLLVVTFTKAAAAEMRARIENALEEKLQEQPENQHLQKQASLLHTAQITTIDSFCQSVIRNYFHVIDLDPVFSVGDETDLELMKQDVLAELLEQKYAAAKEEPDSAFLRFTDIFSTGRTDSAVEELVFTLYNISTSYPWPEEWLNECMEMYQIQSLQEMEETAWVRQLTEMLHKYVSEYLTVAKSVLEICRRPDGPAAYEAAIRSDIAYLEALGKAKGYQDFYALFEAYNPARLKAIRDKTVSPGEKELAKNLRESYQKNGLAELKRKYFFQSAEEMLSDLQEMAPAVTELIRLVQDFGCAFAEKKREEGLLDFADMEHFALQILVVRDEKGIRPSETAKELQEYYEEVLTDEYQDSNFVQELLLTSICRGPEEKPYLFMVGDVKQSIYKFRLARPELFLEKYKRYGGAESREQRIDLRQNFRSRASVLESANAVFEKIMIEQLGGIVYDQDVRLVPGAAFPETDRRIAGKTEMVLIEQKGNQEAVSKRALEAAVIGEKIRDMVLGDNPLYVQDKQGYRPVRYGDIAILLRSLSGWSEEFIEVLNDMGIPAYADTRTGYFTSLEVDTILNLLHVIDNPRQDIPLAAVLRSCLVGTTDEELAWLGTMPQELDFWDKIKAFLEKKEAGLWDGRLYEKLYRKLSLFYDRLQRYQELSKTRSVYELLRRIFDETDYYQIMSAMPSGEKRKANLDILLQQAILFAENGHRGVYGFTRYIESLQKANVDFGEANVDGENAAAVRIMTIHKSKGLEFPIVFVAGMGKRFNLMDARKGTIIDGDYGVGCDYVDLKMRIKQPTLLKRFMADQIVSGTLAEEIRILYVAFTRAKEKLIITGVASGLEKKLSVWATRSLYQNFYQLSGAQTYLDWIMPSLLGRQGIRCSVEKAAANLEAAINFSDLVSDDLFGLEIYFPEGVLQKGKDELADSAEQYRMLKNWDTERVYDRAMHEALEWEMEYQYPYRQEAGLPVKVSVSELKRRSVERAEQLEEEVAEYLDFESGQAAETESGQMDDTESRQADEIEIPRPAFLQEKQLSGAARGTLYHLVMQHFPYQEIRESGQKWTEKEYRVFLAQMVQEGYLSQEEAALLDVRRFVVFFDTEIGARMARAWQEGTLRREQSFMLGISAKELYPEQDSEEMIVVQGIIDAYFTEGDHIVLVDYKTDAVKRGQGSRLAEKYRAQLDYYARALKRLTGREVSEKVIYSFALGEEIFL
ncbi:MAG: helicase-exonuclease AddAB subunit AddA [Clostridiaceae bacterium]|nr:helicase-exonuclease AddAB subunit AddA [Clostridiaceae bacterium]